MTPDELTADMEAAVEADILYAGKGPLAVTRTTTLRALLKAYQEQRRALVACRGIAAPLLEQSEDRVWRRAKLIVDTVDTALN